MYLLRDLINPGPQLITAPAALRSALLLERQELPDEFDPKDYKVECDDFDFSPSCRHVLIQTGGALIAYFRILHESAEKLIPFRNLYEEEYQKFRGAHPNARIAELSRLIVLDATQSKVLAEIGHADEVKLGKRLAMRLFQVMCQYAKKQGLSDIFAQTHPSHAPVYVRHFFNVIGAEKAYATMNNHPAVLLHYPVA